VVRRLIIVADSDVGAYEVDDKGKLRVRKFADRGARKAVSSFKRKRRPVLLGKGDDARVEFEVETEVKLWDKVGALGLLCQHLGMLTAPDPEDAIEALCAKLPPELADALRQSLREAAAGEVPALPG
jgi:hypothetical protein